MVTVEDRKYPELEAIRISLDELVVPNRPPQLPSPPSATEPALQVALLEVSGTPLRLQGAAVNFQCHARDVSINQGRDAEGNVLLVVKRASEGRVEFDVPVTELEKLLRAGANAAASEQGVTVDNVRMELQSRGERALDFAVHVRAKKLFLTAVVRISGSAQIDEQLKARLTDLKCAGDGTLGSLACGFLAPYLQRFDGKEYPLMALPLGEVRLREVRVAAGRDLQVSAQFDSRS